MPSNSNRLFLHFLKLKWMNLPSSMLLLYYIVIKYAKFCLNLFSTQRHFSACSLSFSWSSFYRVTVLIQGHNEDWEPVPTWSIDIPKWTRLNPFCLEPSPGIWWLPYNGKFSVCECTSLQALHRLAGQLATCSWLIGMQRGCWRCFDGEYWFWAFFLNWTGHVKGMREEEIKHHVITSLMDLITWKVSQSSSLFILGMTFQNCFIKSWLNLFLQTKQKYANTVSILWIEINQRHGNR